MSNKYYTIQITGGTSPGPYTIYVNQTGIDSNIPTVYPTGERAENLPLLNLQVGTVVKLTGITTSIIVYNTYCDNSISLIPPVTTTYSDFCFSVTQRKGSGIPYIAHFIYDSLDSNNLPIWVDEANSSSIISWDGTKWLLHPTKVYGNTMSSISQLTSLITYPNNWSGVGGSPLNAIMMKSGGCGIIRKQLPPVSVNQPTCICDGSIIFNVTLDNPPFNYSIDNGVTYSSSPIFTNLCDGIYSLSVIDSLGESYTSSVTLNKPEQSVEYNILLSTTNTTPVINNTSTVNTYETSVIITPPLPDGTTITFDIIHNNSFYSSPTSGTSILTTSTLLYKNSGEVSSSNTSDSTNYSINTAAGCQTEYVYQSNIDDIWNSLTITNTDTITISTSSRVDKTTTGGCVVGYSTDNYSISNPVISGCDCCSIKIN
jgi:hypothetical protein